MRTTLPLICVALALGACAHSGSTPSNSVAQRTTARCAATLAEQQGYRVHRSNDRYFVASPQTGELSAGSEHLRIQIHSSSDGATAWTTVNDRTNHEWSTKPVGNPATQRAAALITRSYHSDAGLP